MDKNAIARAWRAYEGEFPAPLVDTNTGSASKDCVVVNLVEPAADRAVAMLFGSGISFTGLTDEQSRWLDEIWPPETRQTHLLRLGTNGAIAGHVFAKLSGGATPRVIVLDSANCDFDHPRGDIEGRDEYRVTFREMDERGLVTLYRERHLQENLESWVVVYEEKAENAKVWTETARVAWPFPWAPIHDAQNLVNANDAWGRADITDELVDLNESINRTLTEGQVLGRYHAHSLLVARGLTKRQAREVDQRPGGLIVLPESEPGQAEAKVEVVQPAADFDGLLSLYTALREAWHIAAASVDMVQSKLEGMGQLSGVALRLLNTPAIDRIEAKHQTYGAFIKALVRHLLELGSKGEAPDLEITWPEPLPADALGEAETLEIDRRNGLSQATYLEKRGYNPEEEAERKSGESLDMGDAILSAFDSNRLAA